MSTNLWDEIVRNTSSSFLRRHVNKATQNAKKPINIVNLTIYIDIIYLEMMDRGSDFQHFSRLIIKYGVIQPGIHYFEDIAHIYKIITQQSIEHHHDLILMQSGV